MVTDHAPQTKYWRNIMAESFSRMLVCIKLFLPACWFPRPSSNRGNECIQSRRWKLDAAALFGTLIARHQQFYNFQTIFESQLGPFVLKERFHEMTIFDLVSVCCVCVRHDR